MSDEQDVSGKGGRDVSTIAFPYADLADAIGVARAILDAGGVPLDRDQLASAMGQTPSGNFSIKLAAARMFGLVEVASGKNQITPLGFEILDQSRAKAAMAAAFLQVALYKRVFEEFRGKMLPPRPLGLEQTFVSFGVAPKQKDKARQVFDRSARLAGYFPNAAEDRLVAPIVAPTAAAEAAAEAAPIAAAPERVVIEQKRYHPFIEGLLERLPPVDEEWPADRRAKWLEAASNIFDLIYKGDGGQVHIAAEPPQTRRGE